MDEFNHVVNRLALTMGVAWAGGIKLYAAILVLGMLGRTGNMALPPDLQILMHPLVMVAAGFMYFVEFIADKIPGVDTGWDTLHTFIRIPAAALLAAGAVGQVNPAMAMAAALVGGGVAALSHSAKSGTRVLINTSPEPFSNWTASIMEDVMVLGGIWTAVHHPWLFICFLAGFILLAIWLLPKLWRVMKRSFGFLRRFFGSGEFREQGRPVHPVGLPEPVSSHQGEDDIETRLNGLKELLGKGLITEQEYQEKRSELLRKI